MSNFEDSPNTAYYIYFKTTYYVRDAQGNVMATYDERDCPFATDDDDEGYFEDPNHMLHAFGTLIVEISESPELGYKILIRTEWKATRLKVGVLLDVIIL